MRAEGPGEFNFQAFLELKFKVYPLVGTIVLPPRYTGFVITLSF